MKYGGNNFEVVDMNIARYRSVSFGHSKERHAERGTEASVKGELKMVETG